MSAMTADQLQKALEHWTVHGLNPRAEIVKVVTAARSWLALLQADETIIEKMAQAIADAPWNLTTSVDEPRTINDYHLAKARAALAAITGKDE